MARVPRGALAVAATLGLALLAGCAASPSAEPASDGFEDLALEATDTTGVLRGVAVDDAIRPIANATVVARGPGPERKAVTDADGFFGFDALVPGTWFVTASKFAHKDAQMSAEVLAGVSDPPAVKLLLVFVPGEAPFFTEIKIEAFVQCIVPGANMCAIINLYPCAVAGYCEPVMDDTSYVLLYDELVGLQRTPDWFQTELVWQSTQAVSPKLAIRPGPHSPDDGAGVDERSDWVFGPSPIVMTWDRERATDWDLGTDEGVSYEIFGHMDETSLVGSIGFVLNQRVSFFFHAFYGYLPPEGWQFSAAGSAPPPPA